MDAITVAFTKHSIIQYYNYLNARKNSHHKFHQIVNNIENKETFLENNKRKFVIPMPNFRNEVKHHLENILISFKTKNKVVTNNKNVINAKNKLTKIELTPRGQLHKETIYGKITEQIIKEEKINASFTIEKIANITKPHYQKLLIQRLNEYNNDPAKAFTGKNALTKNPIYIDVSKNIILPELVKVKYLEDVYTIRKEINHELKIDKVIDKKIQTVLYNRLKAFNNNPKEAFSNLDKNPIWLNKEKNIEIKRVTISGVNNVASLHTKTDHNGKKILDNNNQEIPVDFVSTGNNHHVAIYKDEKGKLQEKVVSFYEAVERANQGLPIIDIALNKDLGWEFMFTLKQNEMFLFESDDFKPYEIDLFDEKNNAKISKNLFRVQKISSKNYMFVHHLETISISGDYLKKFKSLASHTYNFLWNTEPLKKVLKVRINHIGKIVQIGEY